MPRTSRSILFATALLLMAPAARADLLLSVSQDPASAADLNALSPGEVVTFDVRLTGLDEAGGQTLGFLGATLSFDAGLLGEPKSIVAGDIVHNVGNFSIDPQPGQADASYLDLTVDTSEPINQNGVFFRFTLQVQTSSGSGAISFSDGSGNPPNVFAADEDLDTLTIGAGPDLSYKVLNMGAVPEPSSGLIFLFSWTPICVREVCRWLREERLREAT